MELGDAVLAAQIIQSACEAVPPVAVKAAACPVSAVRKIL
jgi:hypothetical protein